LQWDSFFSSKNAARLLQELLPGWGFQWFIEYLESNF
jgi:hypothetical protein